MPKNHVNEFSPSKYYCFTVNNPTDNDDQQLADLSSSVSYLSYGREKGEGGTPHYQGYVELHKPQRLSWLKARLSRAHLELRRGSQTQAVAYCHKDGDYVEFGELKADKRGARNELVFIKNEILRGVSLDELEDKFWTSFLRYGRYFRDFAMRRQKPRTKPPRVVIHWGASGTGKSRAVFELPGSGQVDFVNNFFQGYQNQRVVLFDDITNPIQTFGRRTLLRLLDRYPMKVNVKNGQMEWNPEEIHFTTNYDPSEWLVDEALKRRITEIRHYSDRVSITPVTSYTE